jgi:hypothetical protein
MSEPTIKLQRNADELLRDFPVAEPDFDAQAKAIEARLKGSPGGIVFDDLLRVPTLAAEPGEPSAQAAPRAASAPKSNFAEMARKSVQKGDHDNAALAKELLAATAQSRRPNAEMVERVRAAGRAPATSTPLPSSEASQRNSGVVARTEAAAAVASAPKRQPTKTHPGTIIGIVGGALALAACVALFLKSGQPEAQTPTSAALAAEKAADAPVAAPKALRPGAQAAPTNDGAMSPEALAAAPPVTAPEAAKGGGAKPASGGAAAPAAAAAAKAAPGAGSKQEAVVLEDDPEPPKAPVAAPKAEAAPEPPLKPAEGSASSVPLNPSAGAVSTALGSVRGGAQACLAGQSDPVTAVVTFAADGHVLRVNASGPSAACIQSALMKAHIAPFAKESFSATTTIRPP